MNEKLVDVQEFGSAERFLEHLDPIRDHWGGLERHWIFRGQANACWELKPSAWRADGQKILEPLNQTFWPFALAVADDFEKQLGRIKIDKKELATMYCQIASELQSVLDFADLANEVGLPVPEAQYVLTPDRFFGDKSNWLHLNLMERYPPNTAFALAQHHGVPTRLLDWTRDPFVAAFFAAREERECDMVAVWALNTEQTLKNLRIGRLEVPRHGFEFLHAQSGLFLYMLDGEKEVVGNSGWPDIVRCINRHRDMIHVRPPILIELQLPAGERSNLLKLLWKKRFSLARLMPNYEKVTSAIRTYWDWREMKKFISDGH